MGSTRVARRAGKYAARVVAPAKAIAAAIITNSESAAAMIHARHLATTSQENTQISKTSSILFLLPSFGILGKSREVFHGMLGDHRRIQVSCQPLDPIHGG